MCLDHNINTLHSIYFKLLFFLRDHNPKVTGSSPVPATRKIKPFKKLRGLLFQWVQIGTEFLFLSST